MEGFLKVTPEKLQEASGEFATKDSDVVSITNQMKELIDQMINTDVWAGEAADTFKAQFHQLDDDMDLMHQKIQEHSKDLDEMARNYIEPETTNIEEASSLQTNPLV